MHFTAVTITFQLFVLDIYDTDVCRRYLCMVSFGRTGEETKSGHCRRWRAKPNMMFEKQNSDLQNDLFLFHCFIQYVQTLIVYIRSKAQSTSMCLGLTQIDKQNLLCLYNVSCDSLNND